MNYRSDTQHSLDGHDTLKYNLSSKENISELSLNQYGLWFLNRLIPDSAMYNIPWMCQVQGSLDLQKFTEALQKVWERHDILRSTIRIANDKPFIVYSSNSILPFYFVDLSILSEEQAKEQLEQKIKEESVRPFDLELDTLVHIFLFQQPGHKYTLFFNMHHLIFDGWSMEILLSDLSTIYNALLQSQEPELLPLQSSFFEFSKWHKQHIQGSNRVEQLQYWKEKLQGVNTGSHFPTDYSRTTKHDYAGKILTRTLSSELMDNLTIFARKERSTLYMVLLAALDILLYKYTNSADFVLASPMAGRSKKEFESLIGYFVNLVVLRTTSSSEASFKELLKEVRRTTLEAHAYQDLPLDVLIQEVLSKRFNNSSPFIQTVFAYEEDATLEINMDGLKLSPIEGLPTFTSKFDSTWTITNKKNFLELNVEFSTDLFEEETIDTMMDQYEWILQHLLENSDSPISSFNLLDDPLQEVLSKKDTIILDSSLNIVPPGIAGTLYISHIHSNLIDAQMITHPFVADRFLLEIGRAKRVSDTKLQILNLTLPTLKIDEVDILSVESQKDVYPTQNYSITGEEIYEVWKSVLATEEIQPTDNFFELGGHSLLAIQIIVRLRDVVATEVPLRLLFETNNIQEFVHAVDAIVLSDIVTDHN